MTSSLQSKIHQGISRLRGRVDESLSYEKYLSTGEMVVLGHTLFFLFDGKMSVFLWSVDGYLGIQSSP